MIIRLNFKRLRKYCGACDKKKNQYSVDIDTEYFMPENIDTYYHEFTHLLCDLIKNKKSREKWNNARIKKYILNDDEEEQLCQAIGRETARLWVTFIKEKGKVKL